MASQALEVLSVKEVLAIRSRMAQTALAQRAFGGGVPLFTDRLESAVARQHAGFGGHREYDSQALVTASLFHGLCLAHAFENGNKRTALVSMLVLLEKAGMLLVETTEQDLYDLATGTASHSLPNTERADEVAYIGDWIRQRTRGRRRGQERMRFHELRSLLTDLGCEFEAPRKNFIKIRRTTPDGKRSVKMGYPNEHFEVSLGELRRVRRRLKLDERSGYDADAFFNLESSVDEFVNNYRQLMNRLADI